MRFLESYKEQGSLREQEGVVARYYLLNADFTVISAITGEENTPIGDSFFDVFPVNRVLWEEIADYVRSYPQEMLLTLCARTPVLFVGTLFAQTGLILAVLSEGSVKKTLSHPAAFHRVLSCVRVSPSAQMRYKAHDEAAFADACRWMLAAGAPFSISWGTEQSLSALLAARAARLGALLGVPLSLDVAGLPTRSCEGVDVPFALGVMLATLFAARRIACAEVQAYAVIEGAPTLYLSLLCDVATDDLAELHSLFRVAVARGAVLDVVCPNERPELLQVRACVGTVELSAQGVRERHRFLEGKSPLAAMKSVYRILPSFPELSLD